MKDLPIGTPTRFT